MDAMLIGVVAGVAVLVLACAVVVCLIRRKHQRRKEEAFQKWTDEMIRKRDSTLAHEPSTVQTRTVDSPPPKSPSAGRTQRSHVDNPGVGNVNEGSSHAASPGGTARHGTAAEARSPRTARRLRIETAQPQNRPDADAAREIALNTQRDETDTDGPQIRYLKTVSTDVETDDVGHRARAPSPVGRATVVNPVAVQLKANTDEVGKSPVVIKTYKAKSSKKTAVADPVGSKELSTAATLHAGNNVGVGIDVVLWSKPGFFEVRSESDDRVLNRWPLDCVRDCSRDGDVLKMQIESGQGEVTQHAFETEAKSKKGAKFMRLLYRRLNAAEQFRLKQSKAAAEVPAYDEPTDSDDGGGRSTPAYDEPQDAESVDYSEADGTGAGCAGMITYNPGPRDPSQTYALPLGESMPDYSVPSPRSPKPTPVPGYSVPMTTAGDSGVYASVEENRFKFPDPAAPGHPPPQGRREKMPVPPPAPPPDNPSPRLQGVDQYDPVVDWDGKPEPQTVPEIGSPAPLYSVPELWKGGEAYAERTDEATQFEGGIPYASFNATLGEYYTSIMLKVDEVLARCMLKNEDVVRHEMLDEGESGRVHRCTFRGNIAAAKVLKRVDDVAQAQLKEEAALQVSMTHPNIVKLFGICLDPAMMVMELCSLGSLEHHLSALAKQGYDVETAGRARLARYGMHVARGLEYLESILLIHRDLATRNVILNDDGVCKIADFGLSKRVLSTSDYYRVNRRGRLPLRWMAPEAIKKGVFTTKSDVWSYGVLLWEIYTLCTMPYFSDTLKFFESEDVVAHVLAKKTLERPDGCTNKAFDIMQRCWTFNPAGRPSFREIRHLVGVVHSEAGPEEPFEP
eukprot:m.456213 g.456213  ORF g.456213 m.456213 type:complete len:849 (+) comp21016_c0_seq1:412-2958(+)